MTTAKHYYESHVTIDPVFDEKREQVSEIAKKYGFKLAHLLMQKSKMDTPEESKRDTFMTGHGVNFIDIGFRTMNVVKELKLSGFTVHRYKIEDILLDSRIEDVFNLLNEKENQNNTATTKA